VSWRYSDSQPNNHEAKDPDIANIEQEILALDSGSEIIKFTNLVEKV
jgi:hypothetical protein